ncbi:MAG: SRPBCC family protein [Acidimicrobiales bacterium]|nr:SRPBCC family protein [Acidimicrobiales bacterium]
MTTTTAASSIEIDAPVEKVFAFVSDPEKAMQARTRRSAVVSDIETGPDGAVTSYKWTTRFGLLHYDLHAEATVGEYVPNERIVVKHSTGPVETYTFAPSGDGTRLTYTTEISTRIPLLEKVEIFAATRGEGLQQWSDDYVAEIKKKVEA